MPAPLPLYRPEMVRAMDAHAIDVLGIDAHALMLRAGAAAWALLRERWPQARRIGVACGPGNNGGDGYVLARLALEAGCHVEVVIAPDGAARSEAAVRAAEAWRLAKGRTTYFDVHLPEMDVGVDALYGTGLSRAPD